MEWLQQGFKEALGIFQVVSCVCCQLELLYIDEEIEDPLINIVALLTARLTSRRRN